MLCSETYTATVIQSAKGSQYWHINVVHPVFISVDKWQQLQMACPQQSIAQDAAAATVSCWGFFYCERSQGEGDSRPAWTQWGGVRYWHTEETQTGPALFPLVSTQR